MKLIASKKGDMTYIGNIIKTSNLIRVSPNTISRWISDKKKIVYKNGYEICLNTNKL